MIGATEHMLSATLIGRVLHDGALVLERTDGPSLPTNMVQIDPREVTALRMWLGSAAVRSRCDP